MAYTGEQWQAEYEAAHGLNVDTLYVEILPLEMDNGEVFTSLGVVPMPEGGIKTIINLSEHKAAKWIKNTVTGKTYYWVAELAQHGRVAMIVGATDYTKGIAIAD